MFCMRPGESQGFSYNEVKEKKKNLKARSNIQNEDLTRRLLVKPECVHAGVCSRSELNHLSWVVPDQRQVGGAKILH